MTKTMPTIELVKRVAYSLQLFQKITPVSDSIDLKKLEQEQNILAEIYEIAQKHKGAFGQHIYMEETMAFQQKITQIFSKNGLPLEALKHFEFVVDTMYGVIDLMMTPNKHFSEISKQKMLNQAVYIVETTKKEKLPEEYLRIKAQVAKFPEDEQSGIVKSIKERIQELSKKKEIKEMKSLERQLKLLTEKVQEFLVA